jgi:hypothetical protein
VALNSLKSLRRFLLPNIKISRKKNSKKMEKKWKKNFSDFFQFFLVSINILSGLSSSTTLWLHFSK